MHRGDVRQSPGESRSVAFRRRRRRRRRRQHLALAVAIVGVAGWATARADGPGRLAPAAASRTGTPAPGAGADTGPGEDSEALSAIPAATTTTPAPARPAWPTALPVGAAMAGRVPAGTRQLVLVLGDGVDSSTARVTFWENGRSGWAEVASWPGHVGRSGWSERHVEGDLRTPVGVYRLSDAGGRLPSPGTKLPYHRSAAFRAPESGPGFGDSAVDAFDHVIAIDYNRVAGRSPLDRSRPLGDARGGGIWLHLDHNGPTH